MAGRDKATHEQQGVLLDANFLIHLSKRKSGGLSPQEVRHCDAAIAHLRLYSRIGLQPYVSQLALAEYQTYGQLGALPMTFFRQLDFGRAAAAKAGEFGRQLHRWRKEDPMGLGPRKTLGIDMCTLAQAHCHPKIRFVGTGDGPLLARCQRLAKAGLTDLFAVNTYGAAHAGDYGGMDLS